MALTRKEIQDRFVKRRKDNGLCLKCGKKNDSDSLICTDCRKKINKYKAETRKWLQNYGICPRCQKNKLYGDEKNCPECSAYSYSLIMPKRELNKEHYNQIHRKWSRKTHQEMIEKGICTRCRKRKADRGYKTCGICRSATRNYKKMKYGKPDRSERIKYGLCYFCDNPVEEGYKVCKKHRKMNTDKANSQKAKEARKKLIENKILY